MCGILGIFAPGGFDAAAEDVVASMSRTLAHRGPDDAGIWIDVAAGVGLGHRRLSIIDLSPAGHQPMISADGRYVMILNGEIYNHRELRQELESCGERFRGRSDTEVLLAAIAAWGVERALARANGMFAFAVWDRVARTLNLARDRAGEKPLYYGWCRGTFLFGSELKALREFPGWDAPIDRDALALFLRHNYVPAPYSIYQGIRKLLPGAVLELSPRARPGHPPAVRRYWTIQGVAANAREAPFQGGPCEAADALEALLRDAVRLRMHADVPVGAFLSGGIDSSAIVAVMQAESCRPVHTFSIGFRDEVYDEAGYARAVAEHLGTHHTELYVEPADAMAVIPRLPGIYDEPFADSSQIPTILVSELARRDVTIALSGDAGDELFGGYPRYLLARRIWERLRLAPRPLRRAVARSVALVPTRTLDALLAAAPLRSMAGRNGITGDRIHKLAGLFGAPGLAELYRSVVTHWEDPAALVAGAQEPPTALTDGWYAGARTAPELQMMLADFDSYLPDDILVKVDRATMSVSLEARVPLLDPRVIELAWRFAYGGLVRLGDPKRVLREVLYRYVPKSMIDRPKMGFGVPLGEWLRGDLRDWAEDLLAAPRLRREGFFEPGAVRRRWEQHLRGERNWQYHLWTVIMFQSWLEAQRGANRRRVAAPTPVPVARA